MNNYSSSPLGGPGGIIQLIALIVSISLGFSEIPFILCILIGAALFQVGYVFVRLPQIIQVWHRDGFKILQLFMMQIIINGLLASFFIGIGRGVSLIF